MLRIMYPNRWFFWCVALSTIIILFVWWRTALFSIELERVITSAADSAPQQPLPSSSTYSNTEYNFSFEHPSGWIQGLEDFKGRGTLNNDMVFGVNFYDPAGQKNMLLWNCENNRSVGWSNPKPTQTECDSVLTEFDTQRSSELAPSPHPTNIFVRVFKTNLPLQEWLSTTYGTEIENYQLGDVVELAGENGFLSSTGCCMSIDKAYVVKRGEYVYEFGSNGDPSTKDFIEKMKDGFRFLQEDASNMPPFETYINDEYGFQITLDEGYVGYRTEETAHKEGPVTFEFIVNSNNSEPDDDFGVFMIAAYDIDWWNENALVAENGWAYQKGYDDPSFGKFINKSDKFAFVWRAGHFCPNDRLCELFDSVESTVSTFKFTK